MVSIKISVTLSTMQIISAISKRLPAGVSVPNITLLSVCFSGLSAFSSVFILGFAVLGYIYQKTCKNLQITRSTNIN